MWDLLFVTGPAATMQTALACMSLCEPIVLEARDIGDALTSVKEVLRLSGDGEQLVEIALYRIAPISKEQLLSWRLHCRSLVVSEARHMQATRRLLKLQRIDYFSLDVEGSELAVLESLDWARIDVGVLGVESYSENDAQIEAMLRSHGLVRVPPPAPLRVEEEAARAVAAAPRGPHHDAAPHEGPGKGGGAARRHERGGVLACACVEINQ